MEKYYSTRPGAEPAVSTRRSKLPCTNTATGYPTLSQGESVLSEFNWFCLGRVTWDSEEGWASELRHYLRHLPADVMKETDIVEWWQIWLSFPDPVLYWLLNHPTRTMLRFILCLPESPLTSSHVRHLQCLASGFSLQVSRQPMIDGHRWVPSSLRSFS